MSKPFVGLSQRSSPLRFLGLVLLWCFLGLVFLLYTLHNYAMIEQAPTNLFKLWDFKLFYAGSLDFQSGGSIYRPNAVLPFERVVDKNGNTPVGALVFLPLSLLSLRWAAGIWVIFSLVLLLVGINYIWRVYSPPKQWHWRITLLLLIYISFPVVDTIQLGSWGMIMAFLDFAVWYYARKRKENLAGIFLGLAVAIRWQPFTILFFFVTLRRWRIIASTLLTTFISCVLALMIFGLNNFEEFINIVFRLTSGNTQLNGAYDGSLRAFLSRLSSLAAGVGLDFQIYLFPIWLILSLAFLALTLWRSRQLGFDYGYSLCVVAGLLLAPTTWFHYHMALLLPLVVVAQKRLWVVVPTLLLWLSINLITNLDFESNPLLFGTLLTISLLVVYGGLYFGPKEKEVTNLIAKAAGDTPS